MSWYHLKQAVRRATIARPAIAQIAGFAFVGAGRTFLSLALYLLFILVVPYWLAFTLSFAITIAFSAFANGRHVFSAKLTWRSYVIYAGVYLVNYLASLCLLTLVVELFGVPDYLAPVPVALCMFPVNFLTERYVFGFSAGKTGPAS